MLSTFVTARRGALQVMIVHSVECHHATQHLRTCVAGWNTPKKFGRDTPTAESAVWPYRLWSLPVSLKESWQLFVLSTCRTERASAVKRRWRGNFARSALSRCVFAEANPPAELPILQRKDETVLRRRTFLCTPVREDLIRAILEAHLDAAQKRGRCSQF